MMKIGEAYLEDVVKERVAKWEAETDVVEEVSLEEAKVKRMKQVRQGFYEKVKKAGGFVDQYGRAEKSFNRWMVSGCDRECEAELQRAGATEPAEILRKVGDEITKIREMEFHGRPSEVRVKPRDTMMDIYVKDTKVTVSLAQWEKLKSQYRWKDEFFPHCVALMKLRYHFLTGGRSGLQDAIPKQVMAILQDHLKVEVEAFASPINTTLSTFCSLYPSTDVVFGSLGSFFDFRPTTGSLEVNPPFTEHVMDKLHDHMVDLLATPKALCFSLIIPEWTDPPTPSITKIREDSQNFLKLDLVVKEGSHGYVDGLSGERAPPFVRNSLILVLMNPEGEKEWGQQENLQKLKERLLAVWEGDKEDAPEPNTKKQRQR